MVVAQLVEQLLPIQEIRGSFPVIGNIIFINCIEKTKIKKKEAEIGPFFKKKEAQGNVFRQTDQDKINAKFNF